MNEVYTDLENKEIGKHSLSNTTTGTRSGPFGEQRDFIDRVNDALTAVSQKLGIRNTNDNITITVSCSESEIERISKEVYEGAKRMGIIHQIVKGENVDPDKIKITSFQSPLGKLNLIPNGK